MPLANVYILLDKYEKTQFHKNPKTIKLGALLVFILYGSIILNIYLSGSFGSINSYTDNTTLSFSQSSEFAWKPQNIGLLKSLKISGNLTDGGFAKVILLHENKSYIIFDSSKLGDVKGGITGFQLLDG